MNGATNAWSPDAIRALRDRLGMTQADFADRLGAKVTTVSRWETGVTHPQPVFRDQLDRLAGETP
jgi:DNA-binding transcriptional regulator YiaG